MHTNNIIKNGLILLYQNRDFQRRTEKFISDKLNYRAHEQSST